MKKPPVLSAADRKSLLEKYKDLCNPDAGNVIDTLMNHKAVLNVISVHKYLAQGLTRNRKWQAEKEMATPKVWTREMVMEVLGLTEIDDITFGDFVERERQKVGR